MAFSSSVSNLASCHASASVGSTGDGVVQCFLCSTFAGTTQFELQNHLQNVHRVTRPDVTALPRYSEADNIAEDVPCSFCSSYSGNTWPKMVDHLKNVHHVARSQVSDTYLGRQAKFELNEKARTLYKKKIAMLLLSTRRVPRLNIQVPQVRERKKLMTMAHVGVSAGCEPMNILCILLLITWKRIIRVHQCHSELKYQ